MAPPCGRREIAPRDASPGSGPTPLRVGPAAVAPKLAFLGQPPADAPPADPVADGQARAVAFLLKQQSDDGAWRSDVYATFKDGTALKQQMTYQSLVYDIVFVSRASLTRGQAIGWGRKHFGAP